MKTDRSTINDPSHPEYNAKTRDAIMDLCPFYDPNHKGGIVREHVFRDVLAELRERERVALESASRMDALSSSGMTKILQLESERNKYLTMLREVAAWMKRLREDMNDGMPILNNTMEARVAAILPENVPAVAPPKLDSALPKDVPGG